MSRLLATLLIILPCTCFAAGNLFGLAYHDVKDRVNRDYDSDQFAVSTENLASHFRWLRDHGYTVVSVDQIIAARNDGPQLPEKSVLLSFDDGLRSVYSHVFPLLKLFGYPAVVAPVTSWIEAGANIDYAKREIGAKDFLTWEQMREMQESGLVEIASHSHNMHIGVPGNPIGNEQPAVVTTVFTNGNYESEADYDNRMRQDLARSAELIQRNTGKAPRVIVWPFGAFNMRAREIAAESGMTYSLTLTQEDNDKTQGYLIGRDLPIANPDIAYFRDLVTKPEQPQIVRAAQVDLDYVYDPDPQIQEANLGRLLDRIREMEISHVFLQAFADPDGDGGADALYFPNRHLPMRADLFNRAAWQLKTRCDVRVFAWLPLLSYTGTAVAEDWRVLQLRDGNAAPDPESEPRLSPFNLDARQFITDIFADLARHTNFDGIHFHDDGRFNEFEDANPAALAAYRDNLGADFDLAAAPSDLALSAQWAKFKTDALITFSSELVTTVRYYRPDIFSSRNLFASALLTENANEFLAQDLDSYLDSYDFVSLMAMPHLEGASDPAAFYDRLVAAVGKRPGAMQKTIFQIQTVDWANKQPLPSNELRDTLRMLQARGARNLAYYPDDFIKGHPKLSALRQGMSLAEFPWRP